MCQCSSLDVYMISEDDNNFKLYMVQFRKVRTFWICPWNSEP